MNKVILFANTDWYLYNFRLSLANRLRDLGHEVILLSPPGEYGPRLIELGFRWHAVPMVRRSLNPLRELNLVLWLARFFRAEQASLVHGFTIKSAVYGSLAARLAGVPARVNSVAGLGYVFTSRDMKARFLRPVVRQVLRLALDGENCALILQNPDDVAMFKSARLANEQAIHLIKGSGVNCARFTAPPADAPLSHAPLRVLLAARMLWDKGIAEFIEAARVLKREGRTIRFILAGTPDAGNPASIEQSTIEGWLKEGLVEWRGHVSDMPGLFAETDVMALPSYREGLPKSLIEAAACALPLITTDAPGCREVVSRNGEDGLVVPVRNATALADAIRLLDDDRPLARKLGLAAREKALREFDEAIVIDRTLAVYRALAPATSTASATASVEITP
ncbi:glycosyltransferase family 4 protein [Caballeronia sp. LP006]|uniref:glycosyltransferase family 4 protein n=1 Tax=Caballeronia sp. LP006 TaxID=3038552 RepID=UPI0028558602|nr:glycosyltransferase family 4 protein [Caballeronia sp. LP006]MDR5828093.1 glycosyltransferase family 4 protein [Caballeronia sp. LP006]